MHAMVGQPQASLENKRKQYSFIEEKSQLGGADINKMSIGENWQFKM